MSLKKKLSSASLGWKCPRVRFRAIFMRFTSTSTGYFVYSILTSYSGLKSGSSGSGPHSTRTVKYEDYSYCTRKLVNRTYFNT